MTNPTPLSLEREELKAKALKACAGPYTLDHRSCIIDPDGYIVADYSCRQGEEWKSQAQYFEALAPSVVFRLLAALEEAEGWETQLLDAIAEASKTLCGTWPTSSQDTAWAVGKVEKITRACLAERERAEKAEQQVAAYRQGVAKAFDALCPACRGSAELPEKASDPEWLALSTPADSREATHV